MLFRRFGRHLREHDWFAVSVDVLVLIVGLMLAFQVVFIVNFVRSMRSGPKAEKNPWKANSLEWTAESPPPHGNWKDLPTVYRGPYEYSVPGRQQDYWPQNEPA